MGNEQREKSEVREKIVSEASILFAHMGIKDITMDDLAEHLGMSKRTIYEHFTDKKELVFETIRYFERKKVELARSANLKAENIIETLIILYRSNLSFVKMANRKYFDDLRKYYPNVFEHFQQKKESDISNISKFLEKGEEEGVIRKGQNREIVACLLVENMQMLFENKSPTLSKYNFVEIYNLMFLNFLRGIITEKGLKTMETVINSTNKENNKNS